MFYVGVTRVRMLSSLYIVANVNKFNQVDCPRRILLENAGITRVDPYVTKFLSDRKKRHQRVQLDAAVFDAIPRAATTPQPSVCSICGGLPDVAMLPCGHLAACAACWGEARKKNVATCPCCSSLVAAVQRVKTSTVCRHDLLE